MDEERSGWGFGCGLWGSEMSRGVSVRVSCFMFYDRGGSVIDCFV